MVPQAETGEQDIFLSFNELFFNPQKGVNPCTDFKQINSIMVAEF